MRIYISGPISGRRELNRLAFENALAHVQVMGHEGLIPHTIEPWSHDNACPESYDSGEGDHTAACYLRGDLIAMLHKCDALFMLGDWEKSIGARLEHSVASHCGMPIYYEFGMVPLPLVRLGDSR